MGRHLQDQLRQVGRSAIINSPFPGLPVASFDLKKPLINDNEAQARAAAAQSITEIQQMLKINDVPNVKPYQYQNEDPNALIKSVKFVAYQLSVVLLIEYGNKATQQAIAKYPEIRDDGTYFELKVRSKIDLVISELGKYGFPAVEQARLTAEMNRLKLDGYLAETYPEKSVAKMKM